MPELFAILSQTNLFAGLRADDLGQLFQGKHYQMKKYARESLVARAGDPCQSLLILTEGSVRGEMSDFTGKRLKIEDIPAPRPLAIAFVFGQDNRFPVDIIANEDSRVMILPRDILINLLQLSPVFLKNYLNAISSRTQFLSNKIRFLSLKTIREKIAFYILSHQSQDGPTLQMLESQSELADFFGVARPSLARSLAELESEGILRTERRKITILDREKLNKLLHGGN